MKHTAPLSLLRTLMLTATTALVLGGAARAHVTLLDPNGGQVLTAGSTYTIRWVVQVQHGTIDWDLHYSVSGASGPWLPIAMDLPPGNITAGAIHTYNWTVPFTPSTQVRVRVTQDNSGRDYMDGSNSDLSIVLPGASYTPFGSGCAGGAGVPNLDASSGSRPVLGTTFTARLSNLATSALGSFLVTGFAETPPTSLASVGMPGCDSYLVVVASDFVPNAGGSGTASLPIPNDPRFLGVSFFQQALVLDPGSGNPAGAAVSNPARGFVSDS